MKLEDAPPPGWYPDPEGYSRLRWWEGTDWSDRFRAPPTPSEYDLPEQTYGYADEQPVGGRSVYDQRPPGMSTRSESEALVNQVRLAAREEAERAATLFGQQARAAARNVGPLISEYTNKLVKWIRVLSVIAILLLIGWLAFQIFAQVSLFEWLGDRIDNLTDKSGMLLPFP